MPAADRFVPLAVWLAAPDPLPPASPSPEPPDPPAAPPEPLPSRPEAELLRDIRLFRARLADALAAATGTLLRELATAVLGRELHAAPADVAALTARILAEHPAATPVLIRHASGDAVALDVPAVADPALAPGDVIVAFTGGEVDARLGVRLAAVLEAWA